ncbi:mitochondrial inner membrane protease subunit 1 [Gigaspora margarita]|uniref:Mitochondrial inner membrane protease subunit 1 n=1 Tax=Gigaspora margarita TaxID=4874 RepID=A0A8H4A916_GIGMA|nr:mitochondrial inner membrane protease subunit 1 [Gigaspora margarita]
MSIFIYISPFARKAVKIFSVGIRAFCTIHITNEYIIEITQCLGPSMLPTLNMVGDFIALERITHRLKLLEIGDVVVCVTPTDPWRSVCKRIIGMPGDRVCIDPTAANRRYITVPSGHVWIQGDNMSNSTDSRNYGPVPYALIKGRVFARVWPNPCWVKNGLVSLDVFK